MKFNATVTGIGGVFISFWALLWILGVVFAKGFVSTVISIVFPGWAFYLVVERFALNMGWL